MSVCFHYFRDGNMKSEEIEKIIKEKIDFLLEKNSQIFEKNKVEPFVIGSVLVKKVCEATGISKMTVWRYLHKLEKEGKIILEAHEPILLKVYRIKLPKT